MYFVGVNAGTQVVIILLACGPCVVIVNCWDRFCTLGRAPHTNETLPDFHEWCLVTRHPRVFRRLTGCQQTPGFWGVTVQSKDLMFSISKNPQESMAEVLAKAEKYINGEEALISKKGSSSTHKEKSGPDKQQGRSPKR